MGRSRKKRLPTEPFPATIESMSHDGRGVAHLDGKATFIHGGLPGEEVMFTYTSKRKKHDEGIVSEVITPSPDRVEPQCSYFSICGGCSLQHLNPEAQIQVKQQSLLDAFEHIGKVDPAELFPPLTAATPWGYRRKARLGVKYVPKKGRVLVGFRERGSSFLAEIESCEVLHPRVGQLLMPLSDLIGGLSIRDRVPQIEVSMGDDDCVLVFRVLEPPSLEDSAALEQFGAEHGMHIYLQEAGPDSVRPLAGEAVELAYALPDFGIDVRFLPNDFTQVNSELNRLMVARAVELLQPAAEDRVLDLFCGIGNFTMPLARKSHSVVGVEGDGALVARARENAIANGLDNTSYYTANLYESLEREPWMSQKFDKALLDPPRSGAFEVLEHLPKLGIRRIVYVSCYPGTLARDAGELVNRHGYKLLAAGVMDMFPHTAHVESIAVFEAK
jgi:23S rRNA (uracil1939-C5)-methyltransferase